MIPKYTDIVDPIKKGSTLETQDKIMKWTLTLASIASLAAGLVGGWYEHNGVLAAGFFGSAFLLFFANLDRISDFGQAPLALGGRPVTWCSARSIRSRNSSHWPQ